jgi:hypothetical protein
MDDAIDRTRPCRVQQLGRESAFDGVGLIFCCGVVFEYNAITIICRIVWFEIRFSSPTGDGSHPKRTTVAPIHQKYALPRSEDHKSADRKVVGVCPLPAR